jgi:hypothetical protein
MRPIRLAYGGWMGGRHNEAKYESEHSQSDRPDRLLAEGQHPGPPPGAHGQAEAGEDIGGGVVKRMLAISFAKRNLARS